MSVLTAARGYKIVQKLPPRPAILIFALSEKKIDASFHSPLGHGAGSMLLIVSLLTLAIFLEIKIEKMNSLDGLTNRRKWFYRLSVFFGAFFVTLLFVNWLFRIFTQEKIIYTSHIVSVLGCMCGAILLPLAIILQNPNMKKHLLK